MAEYKIRCELLGHQEDIRGLCTADIGIITTSRDKTAKIWAEESATTYNVLHTLVGHTGYVGPVVFIQPGVLDQFANGAVVTGSRDTTVKVWDPVTAECVQTLTGHEYQVTALGVLPNGSIVSGALDKSIRIWSPAGKCTQTLLGHEGPVLALVVTPDGDILSGSGDTTIRLWRGGRCVNTLRGHTDTVRALCLLPGGLGFVSGSHDTTVKVWGPEGDPLATLLGHTALVYSVAASGGDTPLIASGSEDNTCRLWRPSGEALAVLSHPGCVWAVDWLPAAGGAPPDLVTGCSDAAGRVFSADPSRQDAEVQARFESTVTEYQAAAKAAAEAAAGGGEGGGDGDAAAAGLPPGVKVEDAGVLASPGAKDGETKLVREVDGSVWAYGWDLAKYTWEKIGEVVSAPEAGSLSTGKKWYLGQEWDYLFDVEMDAGGTPLKLPMQAGENPYLVADRFLATHELPGEFKEQVVNFILQNTGGSKAAAGPVPMDITGGFCDPFTGGGPSSSSSGPPQLPRPPPPAAPTAFDITGGGVDPFTGGTSSSSTPPPAAAPSGASYLLFDAAPPGEALGTKLREFNAVLSAGPDTAELALSDEELGPGGVLPDLLAHLPNAAGGADSPRALLHQQLLARLLRWPAPQLFPALDLARVLLLAPQSATLLVGAAGTLADAGSGVLSTALAAAAVAAGGGGSSAAATTQTALRLLVNMFKQPAARGWVLSQREVLLDGFAGSWGAGSSKGVRLSAATLLLNYAVALAQGPGGNPPEVTMQVTSGLEELLSNLPVEEAEAAHRGLTALTLLAQQDKDVRSLLLDLGLHGVAAQWASSSNAKAAVAASQLQQLLR